VRKKPLALLIAALGVLALAAAGAASAYALRTIFLSPGHCKKVHGTKVCARRARPHTTTLTRTSTVTVTVAPSSTGQSFSGNGSGATSGSSFVPAGTYTFEVSASSTWTLSF
jgi:hypothetical protein